MKRQDQTNNTLTSNVAAYFVWQIESAGETSNVAASCTCAFWVSMTCVRVVGGLYGGDWFGYA